MTTATSTKDKAKPKGISIFGLLLTLFVVGSFMGWIPNPLERFFEIGPHMYRAFGNVYSVTTSTRYKGALKDILDRDGKLTQANIKPLWPLYYDAIPNGFALGAPNASEDTDAERKRLLTLVGATPGT